MEKNENEIQQGLCFKDKTILIIEDDLYNTIYLKEILVELGCTLLFTENGNDAVEIALSQKVDIVLADINLPDISGYQAIRKIKQYKPLIKCIAQTAYANNNDKKIAFENGCIEYISKPLNSELLLSLLQKHLQ